MNRDDDGPPAGWSLVVLVVVILCLIWLADVMGKLP